MNARFQQVSNFEVFSPTFPIWRIAATACPMHLKVQINWKFHTGNILTNHFSECFKMQQQYMVNRLQKGKSANVYLLQSTEKNICDILHRFTEAELWFFENNIILWHLETILWHFKEYEFCRIFVMFCADLQKPAMAAPQIRFQ